MFTDMVGYTRLMGENEQHAKGLRSRHRQALEQRSKQHGGEIIQYYGDGSLITFDSVVSSVHFAVDVQRDLAQKPQIPLRIGIHLGDIVFEEEGVYGQGVNIAARIEGMAVPGSILVSDAIVRELANHPDITTTDLGNFDLKNVQLPVRISAVVADGLVVPEAKELTGKGQLRRRTLAVLPFVNRSSDPENEYFSDGITESILNALVPLEGLQVTSRTSSFSFKGTKEDVGEIARKLGVTTILEGSVRRAGNRVRVTAQLVNAVEDTHLWSETYDLDLEDIFAVEDEIAAKIAAKMRAQLTDPGLGMRTSPPTDNLEAYEHYLRGKFYYHKFNPTDAGKALRYFEQACLVEPNFLLPRSQMASIYSYLGSVGAVAPAKAFALASEHADFVLEKDHGDGAAHVAKALIAFFYEWDWQAVEWHLQQAKAASTQAPEYYITLGMYLSAQGQTAHAVTVMDQAIPVDPLNPIILYYLAQALFYDKQLDRAMDILDEVLRLAPDFRGAIEAKGQIHVQRGDLQAAHRQFEEYQAMTGSANKGWVPLAYVYGLMKETSKVWQIMQKLDARQNAEPDVMLYLDYAAVYQAMGDFDLAMDQLELAYENRLGSVVFLSINPSWDPMRHLPRFQALVRKVDLPQV